MMVAEQVMDMVASKLGKPVEEVCGEEGVIVWVYVKMVCSRSPNKVRCLNLYREGDVTPYGCVLTECRVNRCWSELMERCKFEERKTSVEAFNKLVSYEKEKKSSIAKIPQACTEGGGGVVTKEIYGMARPCNKITACMAYIYMTPHSLSHSHSTHHALTLNTHHKHTPHSSHI